MADKKGKMNAMGKFNQGHWEKKVPDVMVADGKYNPSEFNQEQEYKAQVDGLAKYAKSHKAKH